MLFCIHLFFDPLSQLVNVAVFLLVIDNGLRSVSMFFVWFVWWSSMIFMHYSTVASNYQKELLSPWCHKDHQCVFIVLVVG